MLIRALVCVVGTTTSFVLGLLGFPFWGCVGVGTGVAVAMLISYRIWEDEH